MSAYDAELRTRDSVPIPQAYDSVDGQWEALPGDDTNGLVTQTRDRVTLTDKSVDGTGSAAVAIAANTSRKYLLIQAPETNGDIAWVCLVGTAAANDKSSMQVKPDGGFEWSSPGRVPSNAVSVLVSSGDVLTIWEG